MSFKNKVVLVTGASSGIGASTAIQFAKEGADVVIIARNEKKLKAVEAEIAKVGNKPLVIKADIANDDDVQRIVKETINKYKKLDVLVNNAGIVRFGLILDGKAAQIYDELMNTNLRAVVQMTTAAAPYLVKTKGNIINISSISGKTINEPTMSIYCTTKAALDHFSRATAWELAEHGVRVNVVSPGPVYTDILENASVDKSFEELGDNVLKRVSAPEEIADVILFLASDKAKGITGSDYLTDNGYLLSK